MPYLTNAQLPMPVRRCLPPHAQDIYRETFNHTFARYAGSVRQEEAAHRIAWAAVKRSYVKVGGNWVRRDARPELPSLRRRVNKSGGWWALRDW